MKSYLLETIFFWSVVLVVPSVILLVFFVVMPFQSEMSSQGEVAYQSKVSAQPRELHLATEIQGAK